MSNDDPWGEEPKWAREDQNRNEGDDEASELTDDEFTFAAQHVLILIDCNPTMFVPCVLVRDTHDNDEESGFFTKDSGSHPTCGRGHENMPLIGDLTERRTIKTEPTLSTEEIKTRIFITPFDAALTACERLLRLRVNYVATSKAGKRDGVGVMLYGTKQRLPSSETNDVASGSETDDDDNTGCSSARPLSSTFELIPIAPPGVKQILQIRKCLPGNRNCAKVGARQQDLQEEFTDTKNSLQNEATGSKSSIHASPCLIRLALHEARKAFLNAQCVKKNPATSKRPSDATAVWIFTNEDDPCYGNENERKLAIIGAKDAADNGLSINVWSLPRSPTGMSFNRDIFYNHITAQVQLSDHYMELEWKSRLGGVVDLDYMLEDIKIQWKKARKIQSVPLLFPDWREEPDRPSIMLDLFRMVQVKTKPMHVTIHQVTNKMTQPTTQILAVDTGEIIEQDRIRHFTEFGEERVSLCRNEVAQIRRESNSCKGASLLIVGFKPADGAVPLCYILEKTLFAYPNEDLVQGSKKAFVALHASMIRQHVVGIGELLLRYNGTSRMVAIVPQQEERVVLSGKDSDSDLFLPKQVSPPGFLLIYLPFEDDVRDFEEEYVYTADESAVDAAIDLIRHQKMEGIEIGFSFENPALNNFWNYIEAVALGMPLQENPNDETKMDVESIVQSASDQIEALKICLPEDELLKKGRKRKAIVLKPDRSGIDWVHSYKTNVLAKHKVEELRAYLRSFGESIGGIKTELVDRVKNHLEERLGEN